MSLNVENLPEDPSALKEIIAAQAKNYQEKIEYLEQYIRLLKNEIFGRKSEKHPWVDNKQVSLFDELQTDADETTEPTVEERIIVPSHSRAKRGRKPLPADLPRVDVIHDLDESKKSCPCGCRLKCIGEDVSEKLDYVPAKFTVERHIRYKYACPECEGVEDDGPTVKIAPVPVQLLPKSIATAGLVAHIVCSKFEDALPLYRQEKIFARLGVDIPRATMCSWLIKVAAVLSPLMDLLIREIRSGFLVNADETPVQVLNEPDRLNTTKSYMWVFRGGDPDRPSVVFQYHPTRAGEVPLTFLDGFQGYLQCDDYNGYNAIERQDGIIRMGCWAHARRRFDKVIKAKGNSKKQGSAEKALAYIRRIYKIEKQVRSMDLEAEAIVAIREKESKPVLDEFKVWLDHKAPLTPPKGLLGKAIGYTLNNWKRLIRYLEHGRLRPDNNLAENSIRPFVVGRKNWLFAGHPKGADAAAVYYSLIETAKANRLNPYEYLRYLFEKVPLAKTEDDLGKLLPQYLEAVDLAIRN